MQEATEWITVNDRMQSGYRYMRAFPGGCGFERGFNPRFTPKEMLELGVFEGKYLNDCTDEFPADWFSDGRLSDTPDPQVNFFRVKSREPLSVWHDKGMIIFPDPRGWFQWYCRYWMGRRLPEVDAVQIAHWKSVARHAEMVRRDCTPGDIWCCAAKRQTLLEWSHDPFF